MEKIAVRVFSVPKKKGKKKRYVRDLEPLKHSRVLVFDTETTIDKFQNLKIGYFRIVHDGTLQHAGLFYDNLTKREIQTVQEYAHKNNIPLYSKEEFINHVFYQEVFFLKTLCVCFNQPFDLSRLCINFGYARYSLKGGFSFQLSNDKHLPRIRVKQLNGNNYSINFSHSPRNKSKDFFSGYFLDVQKLASILSDIKKISLKGACTIFNTKIKKLDIKEHGKINDSYINYLIYDVLSTYELYEKLIEEFNKYQVNAPTTQIYSSASIGKYALQQLGIKSFLEQNPNFPFPIIGKLMSAYYGGRTECKIRKTPIPVTVLDFTSMYPSVILLLGLWNFIISKKISYKNVTQEIQKFLEKVTPKDLANKELWKDFNVLVELEPDEDILPVRSDYTPNTFTIGLNHLTFNKSLFYALPDVIVSKLLARKTPKIKKALRFYSESEQETLQSTQILGLGFNPKRDNLIKTLVEKRQEIKHELKNEHNEQRKAYLNSVQKALKILANATSYGIFAEMNPSENVTEQEVFSNEQFDTQHNKIEKAGNFFNPLVAVMITSASRLLLAMAEEFVNSRNSYYAYMDTDSIYVEPKIASKLIEYFESLNPFLSAVPFLKIEKKNRMFYGISSKRYCLYTVKKGDIIISSSKDDREYKLHGLGHLLNPFPNKKDLWHKEIWKDILDLHYDNITAGQLCEKYSNFFAVSQLNITTPTLLRKFESINENRPLTQKVKPFNFMLVGIGNKNEIKPITPFTKDNQSIVFKSFTDYKTGQQYEGIEYWQPLRDIIFSYINHKESKFEGDTGVLKRRNVKPKQLIHIGKETKNIDKQIINRPNVEEYVDLKKILDITPKEARKLGVKHRSTLKRIKDKIRKGKKINLNSKAVNKLLSVHYF